MPKTAAAPYHPFRVHPRALTPAQCRRVVDLGCSLHSARGGLEDSETDAAPAIRDSATAWIPPSEESDWIFRRLAAVAERANRHYRFDLTGFEEDLQFTSYDRPGSHYTWHQDGLDGPVAHRKLSVVVQLTDPAEYRGGALEFLEVAEDYDPDRRAAHVAATSRLGCAVVFPSFEFHRVLPLVAGVRHSLVAWVSGPPFR